jgi:hypothetical protein
MKTIANRRFTNQELKSFIIDVNSEKLNQKELMSKYNLRTVEALKQRIKRLKADGLVTITPAKDELSASRLKAWVTRRKNMATKNETTSSSQPLKVEYRTVFFKDFTIQIHKKSMAKLVIDQNNNIHLNS